MTLMCHPPMTKEDQTMAPGKSVNAALPRRALRRKERMTTIKHRLLNTAPLKASRRQNRFCELALDTAHILHQLTTSCTLVISFSICIVAKGWISLKPIQSQTSAIHGPLRNKIHNRERIRCSSPIHDFSVVYVSPFGT